MGSHQIYQMGDLAREVKVSLLRLLALRPDSRYCGKRRIDGEVGRKKMLMLTFKTEEDYKFKQKHSIIIYVLIFSIFKFNFVFLRDEVVANYNSLFHIRGIKFFFFP